MPAQQLRGTLNRDRIAQAFEGFESPLPLACLLFWVPLIVPRLLITGPRGKEMVDDHENFVGDGQRRLLLAQTHFETSKGASEEGGRFPATPGTWHEDPAQGAIPLARFAAVPFARTLLVPGTHPGPRRQARGVPKATHIRANLGDDIPGRNDIHPRNAIELRDLLLQRCHQCADLLIEGGNLPIQHLNQLQQQAEQRPMVRRELAREGELQLRALVL
jgi:hypothetical protein